MTRAPGRALRVGALLAMGVGALGAAWAPALSRGECGPPAGDATLCVFRSGMPSVGIVTSCRDPQTCRVGYYHGELSHPVWFTPPEGLRALPKPEVTWLTVTLAQVRVDCGRPCSWSYFFEAKRQRLSDPRRSVLAVDPRRLLMAVAEERTLVIRQVFSGREVARVERDWAPAAWLGDVIPTLSFDPDGRLSFTWLRGEDRIPVSERVSVPSIPQGSSWNGRVVGFSRFALIGVGARRTPQR